MLPSDNAKEAMNVAQTMVDPRIRHFYDPKRQVGKITAQSLGESHKIGWDIGLFYSVGSIWEKIPPPPIAWVHQLSDSWLEHYRSGDNLEKELHNIAEVLPPI